MNNYNELEDMKLQLAILNQKLEKERIINEQLMRSTMKDKAWNIRKKAIIESVITAIMVPYFIWVAPDLLPISSGLCSFVVVILVVALGYYYYVHYHFRPENFMHGNLIDARQDTLRLKKLYANWTIYIGIPFLIIFICWFMYEITQLMDGIQLKATLTGVAVGCTISIPFSIHQYRKIQRSADDILQQITDITQS